MNNLEMLEMALNQLKQCTSNEWVESRMGKRYNIEQALSKIGRSRVETYSEQLQNELKPATLREELQKDITACISGYVGYMKHPLRERLTKDICQRISDKIDERIKNE